MIRFHISLLILLGSKPFFIFLAISEMPLDSALPSNLTLASLVNLQYNERARISARSGSQGPVVMATFGCPQKIRKHRGGYQSL